MAQQDTLAGLRAADYFEAGLRPEAWPALLEKLLGTVGQTAAALSGQSQVDLAGPFFSHGLDEERVSVFLRDYANSNENLAIDVFDKAPLRVATDWADLVPVETWDDYVIARDLIRPMGLQWKYAVNLFWDGQYGALLSVLGPPEGADIRQADLEYVTAQCQHLAPAFEMTCRLAMAERENRSLWEALSQLGFGLAIQDDTGRVRKINDRALSLLGGSDRALVQGTDLTVATGGPGTRAASLVRIADARAVIALRLPLTPSRIGRWTDEASGLIVLVEMDRDVPHMKTVLQSVFGATARQVEVAQMLLEGATSSEMAGALGVSAHTVDTHIDRLCVLTGTKNRTGLRNWMMQLRGIV